MKIDDVIRNERQESLSPLKKKILHYLESHQSEVFERRDASLVRAVGGKPASTDWTLWWLEQNGYIEKVKLRKVYFGSRAGIEELKRRANGKK